MCKFINLFGHSLSTSELFNNLSFVGQIIVAAFLIRQFRAVFVAPALVNLRYNKKVKDNFFWRWWSTIVMMLLITVLMYSANYSTNDPISLIALNTKDVNYFTNIFVGPVAAFVISLLLYNSPLKTMDLITPVVEIALVFYKIDCFCTGCCYGVEWEGGLYNQKTERFEFPVQLVEAACAVLMFVILMVLAKKKKRHDGTLYPLFMLMYCGSRFISEFWRDDYPAVLGRLTGYHFSCIAGFVEGVFFLAIVLLWGEKITGFFEAKQKAVLKRYENKYVKRYHMLRNNQKTLWNSLVEEDL